MRKSKSEGQIRQCPWEKKKKGMAHRIPFGLCSSPASLHTPGRSFLEPSMRANSGWVEKKHQSLQRRLPAQIHDPNSSKAEAILKRKKKNQRIFYYFSLSFLSAQHMLASSSLQSIACHITPLSHTLEVEKLIVWPQFDPIIIRLGELGPWEKCCMLFKLQDNIRWAGNAAVLSLGSRALGQE